VGGLKAVVVIVETVAILFFAVAFATYPLGVLTGPDASGGFLASIVSSCLLGGLALFIWKERECLT
jgi:hypothetical protein